MIMYRQKDGNGDPFLLIDSHSLFTIACNETVKFYLEQPEQFEKIKGAGDFKRATMTMLAHRIIKRVEEAELL